MEKKKAAATAASVSVMTHLTYGEKKTKQMMTRPDEIKTHGKKMTNTMLTDKMTLDDDKTDDNTNNGEKLTQTRMQMIENIIMIQANFNEAVIAFMNPKSKSPRPSRLRRQEKRRQQRQMESVKTESPSKPNSTFH